MNLNYVVVRLGKLSFPNRQALIDKRSRAVEIPEQQPCNKTLQTRVKNTRKLLHLLSNNPFFSLDFVDQYFNNLIWRLQLQAD